MTTTSYDGCPANLITTVVSGNIGFLNHTIICFPDGGWLDDSFGPERYYSVPTSMLIKLKYEYKERSPSEFIEWLGTDRN